MMKRLLTAAALLLAAAGAFAQTATGNVFGTVKDVSGAVLPGASVTIAGEAGTRSTVTGPDGTFRLEMPQIIPIFGQPHGHLAYDGGDYKTVFLRPVMASSRQTSLSADFVLQPA